MKISPVRSRSLGPILDPAGEAAIKRMLSYVNIAQMRDRSLKQFLKSTIALTLVACASYESSDDGARRPKGFKALDVYAPEIKFESPYATAENFLGRVVRSYEKGARCWLVDAAAAALKNAQRELSEQGLKLRLFDCYRPQTAVDDFVVWSRNPHAQDTKVRYYPNVEKRFLFREGYIASRSGHSRGATVDLTIEGLDMGGEFDYFDPSSRTDTTQISLKARSNRLKLQALMDRYGFDNLPEEWWHYTLRDEPYPSSYFDFPLKK